MATAVVENSRGDVTRAFPCTGCDLNDRHPGGPDHTPSPLCKSGKHPHCTCDACY